MATIRKSLLQLLFAGAYMKRWNDKLRPLELYEIDKQAHKMMTAWMLFMINSEGMDEERRLSLGDEIVHKGLYDYFYRLIITDIKPPVFYRIKENPEHYAKLSDWVLEQLEARITPLGKTFWERMQAYIKSPDRDGAADRILNAAHLFASHWEFNLIRKVSPWDEELEEIEASFNKRLSSLTDVKGVAELLEGPHTTLGRFAHLCGGLRFQKRWSQTPRVPETTVLGHLFLTASLGFVFSLAVDACMKRRQNNFFAGLVHDLPELLTRDIISPVKQSVNVIKDLIHEYEDLEMEQKVYTPLRAGGYDYIVERLAYLLGRDVGSEFKNTVIVNGSVRTATQAEMRDTFNFDKADPKDGEMLKICDNLAAFMEAYAAIRNGMTGEHFQQAVWRIKQQYAGKSLSEGLHVGALLADFD
jgi:putative hydrolase of HD superfamily